MTTPKINLTSFQQVLDIAKTQLEEKNPVIVAQNEEVINLDCKIIPQGTTDFAKWHNNFEMTPHIKKFK